MGFILKPAGSTCNLRCSYCYYNGAAKGDTHKWDIRTLEATMRLTHGLMREIAPHAQVVKYIWHGGEPLLAPKELFKHAMRLQRELFEIRVANGIQTNGVSLCQEIGRFVVDEGFQIGLSFDCLPDVHDKHRCGSSKAVLKGIELLHQKRKRVTINAVITDDLVGREEEIVRYLQQLGIHRLSLSPAFDLANHSPHMSQESYAAFIIALFDAWTTLDDPNLHIREFEDWLRTLLGGQARVCCFRSNACGHFISISGSGRIDFCSPYEHQMDFRIGQLGDDLSQVIANHERVRERIRNDRNANCQHCRFEKLCEGGCARHWVNGKNVFCSAYQRIFRHVENFVTRQLPMLSCQPGS